MHNLAVIETITNIRPIEGRDRIVLATVANYDTIISKEDFNEGDKCIYCFYDSILPLINPATNKPDFEFLRSRCYSEKYQGFRIRPMKMGGVVSEGLVLPLSVLPKSDKMSVGTIVTDKLGIRLYDPEAEQTPERKRKNSRLRNFLCHYGIFRRFYRWKDTVFRRPNHTLYPVWISKSDEDNIENCYNIVSLTPNKDYVISEKIEGQAATFAINEKGKFKVYSHNFCVEKGNWAEYANNSGMEEKLRKYCKAKKIKGIAIQGELIGPSIQNNIYGRSNLELYIYGGYHLDHSKLTWDEIIEISKELQIPTVPYIRTGKISSLDEMLKDCEGVSVLTNPMTKQPVPREGLVYRTFDGKSHFKVKSRSYKIWWEKKQG